MIRLFNSDFTLKVLLHLIVKILVNSIQASVVSEIFDEPEAISQRQSFR